MTDPRECRLAALRASMAALDLDALLVTSLSSVRYLSGFSGSSALLIVASRDVALITDFRYAAQVEREVGDAARVIIEPHSLWTRLFAVLPDLGVITSIGFESGHVSYADAQRLLESGKEAPRRLWRPVASIVETLREQKDAGEISCIREAVRIAEAALARTIECVRAGMTEREICGILERHLRASGSEAHPFEAIVASGERSALPHARSSHRDVRQGDLLLMDFGAVSGGYCSDITRTFVVGSASDDQKAVYEVVRESNAHASGAVRAGMRGKDADAVARDYIGRRGWGPEFGHSLGHGIGLEVHEAPRLSRTSDAVLPVAAVVTIEPGIYRAGWGGVRIEDDVLLSAAGQEVLTSCSRELIAL